MEAIFSAFLIAVILSCGESALPDKVGNCEFTTYIREFHACHVTFIHDLQKNPKSDCSKELDAYTACAVKGMLICYPQFDEATIKRMIAPSITKEQMCEKIGLQIQTPSLLNGTLPCKINITEYKMKNKECTAKLLKMWETNRADTGTCREFKTTKACLLKIPTDAECIGADELVKTQQIIFGTYNPFCPSGVDEGSSGTRVPSTGNSPTTTHSLSINQKPSTMALFVMLGFVAFLL